MATVEEVNQTFADKGIDIQLPLPGNIVVKKIEVLEKKRGTAGDIGVLLGVEYYTEEGKEVSDLFYCEGRLKIEGRKKVPVSQIKTPLKTVFLPRRDTVKFDNEPQAMEFLTMAFTHLLQDKGYQLGEPQGSGLYFEREMPRRKEGFFVNFALRCDEKARQRVEELVQLRHNRGSDYEYGVVIPAFPEPLGLSLFQQDEWIYVNQEYLTTHRIGLYAVDNEDPNRIYSFTVYPKFAELARYFMVTTSQWQLVRSHYVDRKGRKS